MSFRTSRQNTTDSKVLDGPLVQPGQWVRNPEWMEMPATTSAQEQVDILVAVYPESPYIALNFSTSAGTYTVDWGDGSAPVNVNSGVAAQYLYDYTAAGLTGPGTLPYKQAMVKVTPTTGGASLTTVNLATKNSTANLQAYTQPILDVTISANTIGVLGIASTTVPARLIERCTILRHNTTNMNSLFISCSSLQSVPLFNTAAVTNMTSMFSGCSSLQSVPLFNTAAVTNMTSMFSGCTLLKEVPLFNTAAVTSMSSMFNGCPSLQSVPLFNTAAVTTMSSMFSGCSSLQSVPLFNTALVTQMPSMFSGCSSLQSVPLFNTALVASMASMFSGCSSLQSVPLFNTALVASMTAMFNGCSSLQSVPLFNTPALTSLSGGSLATSIFGNCTSLQSVPLFNTGGVTLLGHMFNGCTNLQSVPAFATNAATGSGAFTSMFNNCTNLQQLPDINFNRAAASSASYGNMFAGCASLSKIGTGAANTGPKFTFTVANCKLSAASLNALYTSLPTVTGQTITVTGNVGIAGDDPTIATGKGWTVTGS